MRWRGFPVQVFAAAAVALGLAGASPARAQSFGPPVQTELILEFFDKQGNLKFSLASYASFWENPFRVKVSAVSPALISLGLNPIVTRQVRMVGRSSGSPLFEGMYNLSKQWSVGFWYNPISDRASQQTVQIADVVLGLQLTRDADLADIHVIYRGPRGLSGQLGYYYEHGTVRIRTSDLQSPPTYQRQQASYTHTSWNAWVTQRLDVRAKEKLLTPFVSLGYHSSADLERAVSILTGLGVTFNEKWSASGSVWFFDLSRAATRITGGVEYRF